MKQNGLKVIVCVLLSTICAAEVLLGDTAKSLTFAAIGDSGDGSLAQHEVANQIDNCWHREPFGFILLLGDNIYGGGKPKYFKAEFEEPYKALLEEGVKFYAVLGNHDEMEAEYHTHYKDFNMGGKRYYSFVKGIEGTDRLVEFFALDTNAETALDNAQLEWLTKALEASKARWKVAFMHHSLFSSGKMHPAYLGMRNQLHPLFIKYKVNLVLAGHTHVYERIKPQDGVQYITEGSSGKIMRNDLDKTSPLTAKGNDLQQAFLLIHVTPKDLDVEAIDKTGKEFDSVTLKAQ